MNDNEKNLNPATSRDVSARRDDAPVPAPSSGVEADRRPLLAIQEHAHGRPRNSRKRKKPFVL
jgi:hypothetical protein